MPPEPTMIPLPFVLKSNPLAVVPIPIPVSPLLLIAIRDVPEPTWNVLFPGDVVPMPIPSKM